MYYTYIIRTENGFLYTGIAKDLFSRMKDHATQNKKCAKFTKSQKIKSLEAVWSSADRSQASRLECALKALTKKQKEDLIRSPRLFSLFLPRLDKEDFVHHPMANLDLYLKKTDLSSL